MKARYFMASPDGANHFTYLHDEPDPWKSTRRHVAGKLFPVCLTIQAVKPGRLPVFLERTRLNLE
jgi:hypothetical protein